MQKGLIRIYYDTELSIKSLYLSLSRIISENYFCHLEKPKNPHFLRREDMHKQTPLLITCLLTLLCCTQVFAAHPAGKFMGIELGTVFNLSTRQPKSETRIDMTDFINNGMNGVLLGDPASGWGEKAYHHAQAIQDYKEAGLLIIHRCNAGSLNDAKSNAAKHVGWGADIIEIDEPLEGGSCEPRSWFSQANYAALKASLPANIPVIVADVFCNSTMWNWGLDGLMQEVYGTNFYPAYFDKVYNWSQEKNRPGYVYVNIFNRQLYNKCEVQTPEMTRQWVTYGWNKGLKIILYSFHQDKPDWLNCQDGLMAGTEWSVFSPIAKDLTAGQRVKFHEWQDFKVEDTEVDSIKNISVQVRSEEAGLAPGSVECYMTTNYAGAWDKTNANPGGTEWTTVPCNCDGSSGTKAWQTITLNNVSAGYLNKNMVQFKIKDLCNSSFYTGNRWDRQQYPVTVLVKDSTNLAWSKLVKASSEHSAALNAGNGNDGNLATLWTSQSEVNPWYQVDLGTPYTIGKIQIIPRRDASIPVQLIDYEIQAANDSSFSSPVVLGKNQSDSVDASGWTLDCTDTNAYRYIRVQKVSTEAGILVLSELRVFEKEAPASIGRYTSIPDVSGITLIDLQGRVVMVLDKNNNEAVLSPSLLQSDRFASLRSGVYIARYRSGGVLYNRMLVRQ
ncbi:MAG: discoidin domain-containing protein [Fibrobacteria bacterium]|nr:discoidin domain-containing protein [Fibrobacteria bacterium]